MTEPRPLTRNEKIGASLVLIVVLSLFGSLVMAAVVDGHRAHATWVVTDYLAAAFPITFLVSIVVLLLWMRYTHRKKRN